MHGVTLLAGNLLMELHLCHDFEMNRGILLIFFGRRAKDLIWETHITLNTHAIQNFQTPFMISNLLKHLRLSTISHIVWQKH